MENGDVNSSKLPTPKVANKAKLRTRKVVNKAKSPTLKAVKKVNLPMLKVPNEALPTMANEPNMALPKATKVASKTLRVFMIIYIVMAVLISTMVVAQFIVIKNGSTQEKLVKITAEEQEELVPVYFTNFEPGKSYSQKINIQNVHSKRIFCNISFIEGTESQLAPFITIHIDSEYGADYDFLMTDLFAKGSLSLDTLDANTSSTLTIRYSMDTSVQNIAMNKTVAFNIKLVCSTK